LANTPGVSLQLTGKSFGRKQRPKDVSLIDGWVKTSLRLATELRHLPYNSVVSLWYEEDEPFQDIKAHIACWSGVEEAAFTSSCLEGSS
jgi:hypothetical protein